MNRLGLLLILALSRVHAQGTDFVVDNQGTVYFAPPYAILRGEEPPAPMRLFRLLNRVEVSATPPAHPTLATSVANPTVSADGLTLAYSNVFSVPGKYTGYIDHVEGVIEKTTPFSRLIIRREGMVGVSRNGRWALFTKTGRAESTGSTWIDFYTGQEYESAESGLPVSSIADDGSVAVTSPDGIRILTPGRPVRSFELKPGLTEGTFLSRDGSTLVLVQRSSASDTVVRRIDLESGMETTVSSQCFGCSPYALSADSTRLFLVTLSAPGNDLAEGHAAIQVLDLRDGSLSTLAILDKEPVRLTVSDDASSVWVATQNWGILHLDVNSGNVTEMLAETPSVSAGDMLIAPGAWCKLTGRAMAEGRVLLGTHEVAVRQRSATSMFVVINPDTPLGTASFEIENPRSPFRSVSNPIRVVPRYPRFIRLESLGETAPDWIGVPLVISESNGDLINPARPALPGEVLKVWLTGTGSDPSGLHWQYSDSPTGFEFQSTAILSIERFSGEPSWWVARYRVPDVVSTGNFLLRSEEPSVPDSNDLIWIPVARP